MNCQEKNKKFSQTFRVPKFSGSLDEPKFGLKQPCSDENLLLQLASWGDVCE